MQAHEIRSTTARKPRKRIGRGNASGTGTYAGKGMKGQKSRSGGGVHPGFEGGQNPLIKGLPKLRGFNNKFRVEYQVVNLDRLESLPETVTEITSEVLAAYRLIRHADRRIKVLGSGAITRPFTVTASKFSSSARQKIEAAGGPAQEG